MLLIPIYVVAIAAAIYGFLAGGWLAVLTALTAGYLIASIYTGRLSSISPMVAPIASTLGQVQRIRAAFGLVLIAIGLAVGGWRWGWAGAIVGYAADFMIGDYLAIAALRSSGRSK